MGGLIDFVFFVYIYCCNVRLIYIKLLSTTRLYFITKSCVCFSLGVVFVDTLIYVCVFEGGGEMARSSKSR